MDKFKRIENKKLVLFALLLIPVVVTVITVSYAFFQSIGEAENEKFTVTTGTLSLTFRDNDEIVRNIEETWNFGDTIEKELVIENTGTRDVYAKISWDNLINTYLAESLTYTLEEKTDETGATWTTVETEGSNVPRSETASTVALADHLFIPSGHTYTYRLRIKLEYLEGIEQSNDLEANFITTFTIAQGTKKVFANETLTAKANDVTVTSYSSGDTGEMYTFGQDYRYIGANPNNWLKFNGEDWRIVGVFMAETASGETEQLIKIIRNESIGNINWDDYTNGSPKNEWPSSSLKALLNEGDYYNRANTYASIGLNETAKSQIEEVKWYLGSTTTHSGYSGPSYYSYERGATTCATAGNCSEEKRSINTIAKVGLMYPSDYVYTYADGVDNTCYWNGYNCVGASARNGWLYYSYDSQWTISPYAGDNVSGFIVVANGSVTYIAVDSLMAVRPTVYLKSSVKIIGGDGASSETAYQIG